MAAQLIPTAVYDTYWRFAAERHATYLRKLSGGPGPWTDDEILLSYRFTNAYRAADRVSQYLIKEVQYADHRSDDPKELFFRTMLFKLFNKIETWEFLEEELGPLSWQSFDFDMVSNALDRRIERGSRIYSAAYIMPSPPHGLARKHANHLVMLANMMRDGLPAQVCRSETMRSAYEAIKSYAGLGPFLAFQYLIDYNYSTALNFEESEFVVAGPGALDGIAKCFSFIDGLNAEDVIYEMCARQDTEFERLGLTFDGLFGRKLQPIDCQNLFCEISKYARVAHPDAAGVSGRVRIKQRYRAAPTDVPEPFFPPKWNLSVKRTKPRQIPQRLGAQLSLF